MTEDEIARASVDAFAENDSGTRAMGIEITDVARGRVTTRMTLQEAHLNGHGGGHGGAIFYLGIAAFGYAANTNNRRGFGQQASINFLAPAGAGDTLTATATEVQTTGRSALYDVEIRGSDGTLIAVMRATARSMSAPWIEPENPQGLPR